LESKATVDHDSFPKFGLTDASIFELSNQGLLVLTDDFPFYGYLISQGKHVINFNHIRTEYIFK
jgi:uncharacterized protein YaiI (UPF0178 family)